jgi:hypothetical protein
MQTFVPYGSDFTANAASLDYRRLGKQRVEGMQILNTITGRSNGWKNHPAVKMWIDFPEALADYTIAMCDHWVSLGYKDTCKAKILDALGHAPKNFFVPDWLNDLEVQISHRSNLIRKFPEHYAAIWPTIPDNLPYKWPA